MLRMENLYFLFPVSLYGGSNTIRKYKLSLPWNSNIFSEIKKNLAAQKDQARKLIFSRVFLAHFAFYTTNMLSKEVFDKATFVENTNNANARRVRLQLIYYLKTLAHF
jgi:hypothetical protein